MHPLEHLECIDALRIAVILLCAGHVNHSSNQVSRWAEVCYNWSDLISTWWLEKTGEIYWLASKEGPEPYLETGFFDGETNQFLFFILHLK